MDRKTLRSVMLPMLGTALFIALSILVVRAFQLRRVTAEIGKRLPGDLVLAAMTLPFARGYLASRGKAARPKRGVVAFVWAFAACIVLVMSLVRPSSLNLYNALYYLVDVACLEEFVFRGYLYRRLRETLSFARAALLGGILYGLAHGLFRFFVFGGSAIDIVSAIGGGIVGQLFFSWLLDRTRAISVPICLHWVLDYGSAVF